MRQLRAFNTHLMFIYGKTASNAIAIMSFLAAEPERRAGSKEIAESREISQALTAKLLTQLASAGLVIGQPGPGGGYRLGKASSEISLLDIVRLFEQVESRSVCPFGHNWCGNGDPCPLHDVLMAMVDENHSFMKNTRLSVFTGVKRKGASKLLRKS